MLALVAACLGCGEGKKGPDEKGIKGKWSNITQQGGQTYAFIANFRKDGSYDGIMNGKVLVSGGSYQEKGDTIIFKDPVCNAAYEGKYRVHYTGDSVHFQLIEDSCTIRRQGTDGVGMKRM